MRPLQLVYLLVFFFLLMYVLIQFFFSPEPPIDLTDLNPSEQKLEPMTSWMTFKGKSFPSLVEKGGGIMPPMHNETLRQELGRSSWHLIHTMANSYPDKPKEDEQEAMRLFIYLIGRLYPCGECSSHFRSMLAEYPPEPFLSNKATLAVYLCKLHNKVNVRLHHPIFDCSQVFERWKCGCAETSDESKKKKNLSPVPLPDDHLSEKEKQAFIEKNSLFEADYKALLEQRKSSSH